jgi:hypothetical protein
MITCSNICKHNIFNYCKMFKSIFFFNTSIILKEATIYREKTNREKLIKKF